MNKNIYLSIKKVIKRIPSHFPGSEVPHDSHFPNSMGRPRNGFESWLAWVIGQSLMAAIHYQKQNKKKKINKQTADNHEDEKHCISNFSK